MVQDRKRRRKKVRIDNSSSESSDSSADEAGSQHSDVEMGSAEASLSDSGDSSDSSDEEPQQVKPNARVLAHKAPVQESDFNQAFLKMVTSEFGDDLENLRKAPDFNAGSLEQLISGLKQGVNIFDESQRKLLV